MKMSAIVEVYQIKTRRCDNLSFFFFFFSWRPACGTKGQSTFLSAEGAFKFFALSYGFIFSLPPWVILPDRLK